MLKLLSSYSEEESAQILQKIKIKKLYHTIYHEIMKFSLWINAVYQPDMPIDKTHMGSMAYSILKFANKLEKQAQEIIDILEKE